MKDKKDPFSSLILLHDSGFQIRRPPMPPFCLNRSYFMHSSKDIPGKKVNSTGRVSTPYKQLARNYSSFLSLDSGFGICCMPLTNNHFCLRRRAARSPGIPMGCPPSRRAIKQVPLLLEKGRLLQTESREAFRERNGARRGTSRTFSPLPHRYQSDGANQARAVWTRR